MAPDQLRFAPSSVSVSSFMVGWNGPWPPPERMGIAVGKQTGQISVFDPDNIPNDIPLEQVHQVADVAIFELVTASALPEEVREHPNIFRGADYTEVT